MMAIISELSMYQATAMKLQQQKHSAKIALEESKLRVMKHTSSATTFNIQLALTQIIQVDNVDSKRVIESSAQFYFLH